VEQELPYFSIDDAHLMYNAHPKLMYTAVYRACSFFTNLDLFCVDNARVIYRKIRYIFWECVCSLKYPACNDNAPYFHLLPARLNIFYINS